jgi:hypothetical protein
MTVANRRQLHSKPPFYPRLALRPTDALTVPRMDRFGAELS